MYCITAVFTTKFNGTDVIYTVIMGHLGRTTCIYIHLISAQTNQEGIKCITAKAYNAQFKKELPYVMKCCFIIPAGQVF